MSTNMETLSKNLSLNMDAVMFDDLCSFIHMADSI
jgi:hypothetical protein